MVISVHIHLIPFYLFKETYKNAKNEPLLVIKFPYAVHFVNVDVSACYNSIEDYLSDFM